MGSVVCFHTNSFFSYIALMFVMVIFEIAAQLSLAAPSHTWLWTPGHCYGLNCATSPIRMLKPSLSMWWYLGMGLLGGNLDQMRSWVSSLSLYPHAPRKAMLDTAAVCHTSKELSQDTDHGRGLSASRLWESKFLLFKPPIYGILLRQPELRSPPSLN